MHLVLRYGMAQHREKEAGESKPDKQKTKTDKKNEKKKKGGQKKSFCFVFPSSFFKLFHFYFILFYLPPSLF